MNQNHLSFERLNGKQTIVIPLDTSNARALLRICKYHKKDKGSPFTIPEEIPVAVAEVVPVERRDEPKEWDTYILLAELYRDASAMSHT